MNLLLIILTKIEGTKEIISFVGDYAIEITNKDKLKGKLYKDEKDRLYQFF
ncbi:hypothetical protein [Lebetimonas sp. JH292]|uniref:hypothetical protein n=1 Tax=Lebetimonas sp. JH292 TaxID=990068 RepID=UPI0012EB0867|nr:hypothetical protein [Lebetimonas sp. JH292]